MKTKNASKKFNLEKFEVAKLNNLKVIKGGDGTGTINTTTDTDGSSTKQCKPTLTLD